MRLESADTQSLPIAKEQLKKTGWLSKIGGAIAGGGGALLLLPEILADFEIVSQAVAGIIVLAGSVLSVLSRWGSRIRL